MLRSIGSGPVEDELAVLRGRAKITLALALFEGGGQDAAFALLAEAEDDATGGAAGTVRTLARIQRSGLHGRLGHWAEALAAMLEIGDAAADVSPRAAAVVALNSGLARQFLGDLTASATDLRRARSLATDHDQPDLAAAATHNLGRLAFLRGEVSEALTLMARAQELSDAVRHSQADLDQARVLLDAGLLDAAESLLVTAETEARGAGLDHDVGEAALERARRALLLGEYDRARVQARTAARAFARRGEEAWRSQAELLGLEAELARTPRVTRRLVERTDALADSSAAVGGLRREAVLLAAEASVRCGDPKAARQRLADLVATRSAPFTLPHRLHRLLVRALVDVETGDRVAARRSLRDAVGQLAREQGRHAGLDTRTAVALHGRRLLDLDVTLALPDGPVQAYAATERWRGVSSRLPRVSPTADAELNDLVATLRQGRLELAAAGEGERPELAERVAGWERAVQRRDWQSPAAQRSADRRVGSHPVSHAALRSALDRSGAGLINLFGHGGRLRAVTITPGRTWLTDLGELTAYVELGQRIGADLTALTRSRDPRIRPVVERVLARSLSRLSDLLQPAVPATDRVVVLPFRALATVPWRLLPGLVGRPVTVAPTATFWHRGTGAAAAAVDGVVCVAGPGLRRAVHEVEQVAALVPGGAVALSGVDATGTALTAALRDRRVVHVAAHGSHHEQSPLFSSILLADGPLFAHEFQRVGVGAEHVVLSACDVGRARVRQGEEALGLTSALLACGVRSVVAAVAPVDDDAAATVMTAYHREVLAGADAALALERASADVPDGRLFCTYGADWSLAG